MRVLPRGTPLFDLENCFLLLLPHHPPQPAIDQQHADLLPLDLRVLIRRALEFRAGPNDLSPSERSPATPDRLLVFVMRLLEVEEQEGALEGDELGDEGEVGRIAGDRGAKGWDRRRQVRGVGRSEERSRGSRGEVGRGVAIGGSWADGGRGGLGLRGRGGWHGDGRRRGRDIGEGGGPGAAFDDYVQDGCRERLRKDVQGQRGALKVGIGKGGLLRLVRRPLFRANNVLESMAEVSSSGNEAPPRRVAQWRASCPPHATPPPPRLTESWYPSVGTLSVLLAPPCLRASGT